VRETLSVASQNSKKAERYRNCQLFFTCCLAFNFNMVSSKFSFLEKMASTAGKIPVERNGSKADSNIQSAILFLNP
jgi:hypothetical protein